MVRLTNGPTGQDPARERRCPRKNSAGSGPEWAELRSGKSKGPSGINAFGDVSFWVLVARSVQGVRGSTCGDESVDRDADWGERWLKITWLVVVRSMMAMTSRGCDSGSVCRVRSRGGALNGSTCWRMGRRWYCSPNRSVGCKRVSTRGRRSEGPGRLPSTLGGSDRRSCTRCSRVCCHSVRSRIGRHDRCRRQPQHRCERRTEAKGERAYSLPV